MSPFISLWRTKSGGGVVGFSYMATLNRLMNKQDLGFVESIRDANGASLGI